MNYSGLQLDAILSIRPQVSTVPYRGRVSGAAWTRPLPQAVLTYGYTPLQTAIGTGGL